MELSEGLRNDVSTSPPVSSAILGVDDRRAWIDAVSLFAFFLFLNVVGNATYRFEARVPWLQLGQAVLILLVTLAAVAIQRGRGRPFFAIGSLWIAFRGIWWLWSIALAIALVTAGTQGMFASHSTLWYLWLATGVAVAPLTEELVFRGAIQTSINSTSLGTRTFLSFRLGTLISAMLFSCSHFLLLLDGVAMSRVLFEVLSALPLALVTGYIYQRTSNLWYGIILHALGNLGGA